MNVGTIMSRGVWTVGLDDTLAIVQTLFESHGFHHAVVTERGRAVGVISDRDLLRNLSPFVGKASERPQDLASLNKHVHQVMSRRLVSATERMTVNEAAAVMVREKISCLPVIDDGGRCVGIVTARDVMAYLAAQAACDVNGGPGLRAA